MSRQMWALVVVGGLLALATLVGAVLLAVRVVRTRRLLGTLGVGGRVAFYGALVYTVLPVDLLPDPIYLDDMGVLAGALIYLTRLAHRRRATDRRVPGQPGTPARSGVPPGPGPSRRIVS
ncbi:YkvA family protein [Micromonospora sp. WMMD987]|uniref:YkvA family protein n=1 Tax=Micromonospora TaxID=1873 RepID=UPI00249A2072|nr:YkvA family protein [Micromonospora sp. WMMD987]WFE96046.1 YkvA family protein [Micromonospora sp. WMMD987]